LERTLQVRAHAVARDAAGGVVGVEEGGDDAVNAVD